MLISGSPAKVIMDMIKTSSYTPTVATISEYVLVDFYIKDQSVNDLSTSWTLNTETFHLSIELPLNSDFLHLCNSNIRTLKDLSILFHEDEITHIYQVVVGLFTNTDEQVFKFRLKDKQSNFHWLSAESECTTQSETGVLRSGKLYVFCPYTESERLAAEQELRLLSVAFESNEGIAITDQHFTILKINDAFKRMTQYDELDIIGLNINNLTCEKNKLSDKKSNVSSRIAGLERWRGETQVYRKNGEPYLRRETITAVKNDQGKVTHYVICCEDISEQKAAEDKIRELAFYDALTGLANRRLLNETIEKCFDDAKAKEHVGALLFIDLDYFKTINDSLGHAVGDFILERVATRLKKMQREDYFLSRIGGDEFVLLIPQLSENPMHAEQYANLIAQQFIDVISAPYYYQGQALHIGASIGVTLFPSRGQSPEDLLKQADTAMYQAKAQGRKSVAFFNSKMQREADKRLHIHNCLQSAIANDEFILNYQSQHMVQTGELIGVEALIRWNLGGKQLISPAEFIPIAEETNLIIEIGAWVLKKACEQFIDWQERGLNVPQVSVNISAKQFHNANFVNTVTSILDETGMDPMQLNLEVTESVVIKNVEDTIRKMTELKNLGISFAIDDFGAGYSSLAYLKRLPANELKIDRSFIQDIPNNISDMAIVEAVLAMAKHMDFNVTAEGVESRQQLEFLQRQQCSFYQGFYSSKPLSSDNFEAFVRRNHNS